MAADKATKQLADPLTPAEVEIVKGMIEERQAKLLAQVQQMIAAAVDPLAGAIKYGDKVALRANSGVILSVLDGGPTDVDKPVEWTSRPSPGPWESLKVEKGV